MSYPYSGAEIEALITEADATPAEAQAIREVLAEVDAGDPPPDPYGPWDDFNDAAAQMDAAHAADAQRLAEDVSAELDRRPSAEVKIERAMRRIEAGTYTEPAAFQPARDAGGHYSHACGPLDDTGRCASRYHDPGCSVVIAAAAATGDATAAEQWALTLRDHPPDPGTLGYAAELAEPDAPADTWADLLQPPGSADPRSVHARMLAILEDEQAAEPGYEPVPPETMPPVTDLRAALGL